MSHGKKRNEKYKEESEESENSEDSEEITAVETIESYIEASEKYIEIVKLEGISGSTLCIPGMIAINFGKAYLAFTGTTNKEAIKVSLKE